MFQKSLLFPLVTLTSWLSANAVTLDINNKTSIYEAQALVVQGMMDYYNGNNSGGTPGMFQPPYYWWESGVAWNSLLDYTYLTGNTTFSSLIESSMLFQDGKDWDYMPSNQTTTEGNDDQGFWGILAITAAEKNFTNPGPGNPSWLYLAQAVFNTMASRWDNTACDGGLRWQIYTWNTGYNYKNSVANGCLFNIGARLYRYTGNSTYLTWCETVWDWATGVQFVNDTLTDSSGPILSVYDGADMSANCTDISKVEWTYNSGLFMSGAAFLYNATFMYNNGSDANATASMWLTRVEQLWGRATVFFSNQVMYEAGCQLVTGPNTCNNDERCFKGIFSKFLGYVMLLAPSMNDVIRPYIFASAQAAAESCSGGTDGHTCGLDWLVGKWDGIYGLGEQICAVDIFNLLLIHDMPGPLTQGTGATSVGDPAAGTNSTGSSLITVNQLTISTKDKAGAGVITALVIIVLVASGWWMMI